ncbi:TetR/AcrR family transcriptional regulator [Lentilactobacillus sp. Marseille-Q4993]|uniref:TetR/AcrR family transcriptional regulator n=1 Tax=Lentilactobacillus sp. Marseille-Q4993 TaxID=3039492 RepID=UPI0024BC56C6|nr:TetR/AcrR family transcriptional regulator [Lentilactobacillus sp. Marseille-Q4993]
MGYDKKNEETNNKIIKAFLDTLAEKSFEEISVRDISTKAGVNRGTFYRHFLDKYDLLDKIEDRFLQVLEQIPRGFINRNIPDSQMKANLRDYLRSLFVIVKDNSEMLARLFSDNGDQRFKTKFKDHLAERIRTGLNHTVNAENTLNLDLAIEFISAADTATVEYIIDHPELDSDEIFNTFFTLLVNGPLSTLSEYW